MWKNDAPIFLAILRAESGLRCDAVGDKHQVFTRQGKEYGKSYGPAQIRHLPGRPDPNTLLDCVENLGYAYRIWQRQGFNPWSAYKNKSYQKYLKLYEKT